MFSFKMQSYEILWLSGLLPPEFLLFPKKHNTAAFSFFVPQDLSAVFNPFQGWAKA